jgi:hypothetical protein
MGVDYIDNSGVCVRMRYANARLVGLEGRRLGCCGLMSKADAIKHATDNLKNAKKELKDFDDCVTNHHLRLIEKQPGEPERDVTASRRHELLAVVEEWRAMLRYAEED